jgi:hypothetical protein
MVASIARFHGQKSTLRTVRISNEVAEALDRVAEEHGITFNALANKIMKKYVDFDQFAEKLNFVTLPRETLKSIIQRVDDPVIQEIGTLTGERVPAEVIFYFYKELSVSTFIRHLRNMSKYYRIGEIEFGGTDRHTVIAVHHDMGLNWSLFLSCYLTQAAKRLTGVVPTCNIEEELIALHFELSEVGFNKAQAPTPQE